jgi:hypothetical protein
MPKKKPSKKKLAKAFKEVFADEPEIVKKTRKKKGKKAAKRQKVAIALSKARKNN